MFPPEYDHDPPTLKFITIPFHPNIDLKTGSACTSLFNERWTGGVSIIEVLVHIQCTLHDPIMPNSVFSEPNTTLNQLQSGISHDSNHLNSSILERSFQSAPGALNPRPVMSPGSQVSRSLPDHSHQLHPITHSHSHSVIQNHTNSNINVPQDDSFQEFEDGYEGTDVLNTEAAQMWIHSPRTFTQLVRDSVLASRRIEGTFI